MNRLARFLVTDIATSIDSLVGGVTRTGFCHTFTVKSFNLPSGDTKNMIYFDGCANHLGCTVMLRGASASELKKVNILIAINLVSGHLAYLTVIFLTIHVKPRLTAQKVNHNKQAYKLCMLDPSIDICSNVTESVSYFE